MLINKFLDVGKQWEALCKDDQAYLDALMENGIVTVEKSAADGNASEQEQEITKLK